MKFMKKGNKYLGAMVLGLSDAIVQTTGIIVGLSFALIDSRIIVLTAIISGISASFSMGASNYLSKKADGDRDAVMFGFYTGIVCFGTAFFLVLPFILLPNANVMNTLAFMLVIVTSVILLFSYSISVVRSISFPKCFAEMISVTAVASFVAFVIGVLARQFFGVEV